jgi:tRNA threonylcarbamoyladenosine biosynthesis protein TsaB
VTPLILALDTTGQSGSLALARGGDLLEERRLASADGFGESIHREIAAMLERQRVTLRDVDGFAAASGPGSFTGVRVGLACIKGLAEALGKPAFGVSNLRAIARFGTGPMRGALIDARRGDVYGAVYDSSGALIGEETVGKLETWLGSLPSGDVEIVSMNGLELALDRTVTVAPPELAGAVARIAAEHHLAGERPDPAALDANYVRRSDAELFLKE